MRPFVSVIIPTLNEEKYIETCLRSVKNQDYPTYEIIVSDSGSKDNTKNIAKKYARVVNAGRGAAAARNKGAKVAKGNVFIFIDADSVLLPDALGKLAKPFQDKHVVGVGCYVIPSHYNLRNFLIFLSFNELIKSAIKLGKPQVPGVCSAYRKNAFEKIGGFDEKFKTLEDFDLSLRISRLGKIKLVKDTFVITSHRRIEKWGSLKSVRHYLHNYSKFLLTRKTFGANKYRAVR